MTETEAIGGNSVTVQAGTKGMQTKNDKDFQKRRKAGNRFLAVAGREQGPPGLVLITQCITPCDDGLILVNLKGSRITLETNG